MSCDKLVFDLSQEIEGSPNVFIRKDWLNILDNQNQNYQNNQSIIDTSQLSNSNKWMSYREAYLAVPMTLTIANSTANIPTPWGNVATGVPGSVDGAISLKNWFGTIIHSFTLDYNGTTIIQQTPFINMWNSFKLMTTLSWNDVLTQGSTIGFYPDDPTAFVFNSYNAGVGEISGQGLCNNRYGSNFKLESAVQDNNTDIGYQQFDRQNEAIVKRINSIVFDDYANINDGINVSYSSLINTTSLSQLWRSYISSSFASTGVDGLKGYMQISIMATIYLKHVHSFFNMVPLLKGAFMKMTMNLNNAACSVRVYDTIPSANVDVNNAGATGTVSSGTRGTLGTMSLQSAQVPVGGVNPIMLSSLYSVNRNDSAYNVYKTTAVGANGNLTAVPRTVHSLRGDGAGGFETYICDLSVGSKPLSALLQANNAVAYASNGTVSKSIYLYVPAYSFNPTFESAYLSSSPKQIKYTDVYQYQVLNVGAGAQFNNLITNGIANIKSVLILPLLNSSVAIGGGAYAATNLLTGIPSYQSPFDPVGTGTTAPLVHFQNFNVQISGQNAIYNMQRYTFEQFNNQLYGQNAVNGGLTDGLTSGLIDYLGFQMSQCFYYVNVERMLPVEQSVPKSVQILGTNMSQKALDLWVFVEYGVEVSIDLETGARV